MKIKSMMMNQHTNHKIEQTLMKLNYHQPIDYDNHIEIKILNHRINRGSII